MTNFLEEKKNQNLPKKNYATKKEKVANFNVKIANNNKMETKKKHY